MKLFFKSRAIYVLLIICYSCQVNKNLPLTKDVDNFPYGAQAQLVHKDNLKLNFEKNVRELIAEIIAIKYDTIYLKSSLRERPVYAIHKDQINKMNILFSLTSDNPEQFAIWATMLCLITISHGVFAPFTLPLNLIIGANTAEGAAQSSFATSYPDKISWEDLKKFARFPQGLPEGVTVYSLK